MRSQKGPLSRLSRPILLPLYELARIGEMHFLQRKGMLTLHKAVPELWKSLLRP